MTEKIDKVSILDAAVGAIKARTDYELKKVIENIMDVNTRADKKRTLTITLEMTPDVDRTQISMKTVVKSKLEPTAPIASAFALGADDNGEIAMFEMFAQVPGQTDIFGSTQEKPIIVKLS